MPAAHLESSMIGKARETRSLFCAITGTNPACGRLTACLVSLALSSTLVNVFVFDLLLSKHLDEVKEFVDVVCRDHVVGVICYEVVHLIL